MIFYALLLLIVGCKATQWTPINDFKETFKEYSVAALDTISIIENILETSKKQSESFLNSTYTFNRVVNIVTEMKSYKDRCFVKFIDNENFKFSFEIQIYQLQIPLLSRIVDIRERLNNINYSIGIYPGIAESKLRSCKPHNRNCTEETNLWLASVVDSLYCKLYPNCSNHSIRKRTTCENGKFTCRSGSCIQGNYFCDGDCDCPNCEDEPKECVASCFYPFEFRCPKTYRCFSISKKCDGIDDCEDGSDEDGCPAIPTTTSSNKYINCSLHEGYFLCNNNKCVVSEQVCDGYNDCGDWSDEGDHCNSSQCSPECAKKGRVCFTGPQGSACLYECPPGTYETSKGCSRNPEAPLPTLLQVLEDTPRLIARYSARLKYLKIKTIMVLSKAFREVVRCKGEEFTLLSKIIDFSTIAHEEGLDKVTALASSTEATTSATEDI